MLHWTLLQVWEPGPEHSYTGPGFPVHVGNLLPEQEDELWLSNLFSRRFGSVLAATVRVRHGTKPNGDPVRSWAILSFYSERVAGAAVQQGVKDLDLKVMPLRLEQAIASTGVMGQVMRMQFLKAELRSTLGDVICETPGPSDVVGDPCCAVRLYGDGRVLLVRRAGLLELTRQELEQTIQLSNTETKTDFEWTETHGQPSQSWSASRAEAPSHTATLRRVARRVAIVANLGEKGRGYNEDGEDIDTSLPTTDATEPGGSSPPRQSVALSTSTLRMP